MRYRSAAWLLATHIALISAHASGQVINGDTLILAGKLYRLWGIDAPESEQHCADGWPAGAVAKARLQTLMQSGAVHCEERERDIYGQSIAACTASGRDLGAALVREGLAWPSRQHDEEYFDQQASAKEQRLGIHGHQCTPPWIWRAERRQQASLGRNREHGSCHAAKAEVGDMANQIAVLGMVAALGLPDLETRSLPSAGADAGRADASPRVQEGEPTRDDAISTERSPDGPPESATVAGSDLPAPRLPVPFWRQPPPPASSRAHQEVPEDTAEHQSPDALDKEDAKAAIERDGYKKVVVLGKASNGAWHAKAYRGVAEVFLTVDSDGTVSSE